MSAARQTALAGDRYADYPCDRCDQPIGPDGTVVLTTGTLELVWECWCVRHQEVAAAPLPGPPAGPPQHDAATPGRRRAGGGS